MAQPTSQSEKPRRARRTHAEQKQALADKIAALDQRLIEANRKMFAKLVEDASKIGEVGLSEMEREVLHDLLSHKPQ